MGKDKAIQRSVYLEISYQKQLKISEFFVPEKMVQAIPANN